MIVAALAFVAGYLTHKYGTAWLVEMWTNITSLPRK